MQSWRLAAFALAMSPLAAYAEPPAVAVASVEARLFFAHTGEFSAPVIPSSVLWNTIIGEEPSTSTLVKVLVTGPRGSYNSKTIVSLTVAPVDAKGGVIVFRKGLGPFSPEGRQFVAFWLPNTGCQPLQLVASVTGSKGSISQVLPFKCGE